MRLKDLLTSGLQDEGESLIKAELENEVREVLLPLFCSHLGLSRRSVVLSDIDLIEENDDIIATIKLSLNFLTDMAIADPGILCITCINCRRARGSKLSFVELGRLRLRIDADLSPIFNRAILYSFR